MVFSKLPETFSLHLDSTSNCSRHPGRDGADIRVIPGGGGFGFAAEAGQRLFIMGKDFGKELRATKRCERVSSAL